MQQQSQTKNTIIFVVVMALSLGVWALLRYYVFPPPPAPPPPPPTVPAEVYQAAETVGLGAGAGDLEQGLTQAALLAQAEGGAPEVKPAPTKPVAPPPLVAARPPTPQDQLKTLGEIDRNSKYHLYVQLDPRGASVRRVVLNKFQQADSLGRPVNQPDGSPEPLTLVPDDPENPSNQLLHYNVHDKDDDKPFDALGKVDWTIVEEEKGQAASADGRQSWTFVSPPAQGFVVTKTYSLAPGEYHVGLEVNVKRVGEPGLDDKPVAFRYQLTGAHGLPVEGRWYTNYFRNALIGQVENKPGLNRYVARDYQDLRQISAWEGGTPVDRQQGYLIRYAGVTVQYFASAIVVDDKQDRQDFLVHARPTMERAVVKGVVKSVDAEQKRFVLTRADNGKDETFWVTEEDRDRDEQQIKEKGEAQFKAEFRVPFRDLAEGLHTAVVYTTGGFNGKEYPEYARELRDEAETQPLWENDVTVRVATEPIELKSGQEFTHKYLLYNGPVKVMLLGQADTAAEAVAPGLVSRYIDDLNLNTLTDYQSPSWIGSVTGPLGISWMLIQITNVMHWVLWFLHAYLFIPYILCIVCLTIMVRGAMFPISRKQALTSLRMQQLAPELKKLQEKFKDDKQALTAAQMELYRKQGVNPFGTCWLLALQMPIFMGLYYSLQESIHFRLQGLMSPWWIPNLSAPDMLVFWNHFGPVPFIGSPAWYGWLFYLGPYLNILPIIAVSLMLVQQKWTMPPPTDEQQEQQQKMMKYMMVFMGLMFYKVASGLCIYFIASSAWGFMERQLLPKKKPVLAGAAPPAEEKPHTGIMARFLSPKPDNGSSTAVTPGKGKRAKRRQEKPRGKDDSDGSMLQRLRDWWDDILEQARKK